MQSQASRRPSGFTLIELLIAMSIFLLILLAIYQLFDTNRATYVSGTRRVDVQQNARVAMDEIAREIRMANYFPENFDTNTGNDLVNARPIQIAQNNALAIFGDADGSGTSKIFLYCLNGTNVIRKGAVTGGGVTGPAQAYQCTTENVPNVRVGDILAENITFLQFTYYDANNTAVPDPPNSPYTLDAEGLGAVPPFAATAERGAVRTVVITLTARETVPIPGQQAQSYTLTSSVRLRNLN
jgi:prepilin-type N-terminal cleavage/methylation domain-containing protein